MIMRAWAFVGRTKTVLYIFLAAYVILIALNIWVFAVDVVAGDLKVFHSFWFATDNDNPVEPSSVTDILGKMGCFRGRGRGPIRTPQRVAVCFSFIPGIILDSDQNFSWLLDHSRIRMFCWLPVYFYHCPCKSQDRDSYTTLLITGIGHIALSSPANPSRISGEDFHHAGWGYSELPGRNMI